ncbi:MAG: anthranilate synthase component I family protein [Thermoleophilia bacterium]
MDPVAALAALAGRRRPVLVRHGGLTVVAADPADVAVGAEVWEALDAHVPRARTAGASMAGGWIGLLAYDLGGTLERLPPPRPDRGGPPLAAIGRYDTVAAIDDDGRCAVWSVGGEEAARELAAVVSAAPPPAPLGPAARRPVATSLPGARYREAVDAARELIRAGDCYQVNLVQRLVAPWERGPIELARRMWSAAGPAPHRAYLGMPEGTVVSASPELLVRAGGGVALSSPIKGTAPPGRGRELLASAKDRAEHVMIVDLVRNDLGRVARPGGVSVPRLFSPLTTPYAEHMVSDVRAEMAPGATAADLLRAVFPGGSVTGCPKVRSMEIIRELEPAGRGPAFGSVLALGADGTLEASVAIRTAWLTGGEARYWCGGAVVWDSDPEAERVEAWTKAAPFLAAVGADAR